MKKIVFILLTLSLTLFADAVYTKTYNAPMSEIYPKVLTSFDSTHLVVVSEIDILAKFKAAGLPKKLGKEFNTNNLTGIKAIIACNGTFGNGVANADPKMMAFCPVRITIIEQDGKTTITYVRAGAMTEGSKAHSILVKLEAKVINAIETIK